MQQRGSYASPACQHVIRVFLWEPRAESGGRRCGREGGGGREEERETEAMKGSMPGPHSSLSGGELHQTKARPINQAIISCKEKALTSSSNWLIHLAAQDRLALPQKNCTLTQLGGDRVERRDSVSLGAKEPGEFCPSVSSLEKALTGGRQGPVLSPGGHLEPGTRRTKWMCWFCQRVALTSLASYFFPAGSQCHHLEKGHVGPEDVYFLPVLTT